MVVLTKYGEMDDEQLEKKEYVDDTGALVVEYFLHFELVHRSAAVQLQGIQGAGETQTFG